MSSFQNNIVFSNFCVNSYETIFKVLSKDSVFLTLSSDGFCLSRRYLTQTITRAPARATNIKAKIDKAMVPTRDSPGSATWKTILRGTSRIHRHIKTLLNNYDGTFLQKQLTLHKKWSFSVRISSVNVTKSAVSCGFSYIYWRNS